MSTAHLYLQACLSSFQGDVMHVCLPAQIYTATVVSIVYKDLAYWSINTENNTTV